MKTLSGLQLAITIDVLVRVSLVLTAALLLAVTARRNAALRHAILVAGLIGTFIMPAAMLTLQVLPVSRLQLGLLGRVGPDDSVAVTVVSSRLPSEPRHRPASLDHPAPAIISTRGDEVRPGPGADASARLDERPVEPRALKWLNVPYGRWMASALLSALLFGAIVKVTGLGLRKRSLVSSAGASVQPHAESRAGRGVRQLCDCHGRP